MDALLEAFLRETDEEECSRLLERLICEHAQPVVSQIIGSRLQGNRNGAQGYEVSDAEDIQSEVLTRLIKRLLTLKSDAGSAPIDDFLGYAAVIAFNACHHYFRQKHPQRQRLKHNLVYILTHQKGLALWQSETGEWLCGFEDWRRPAASMISTAGVHSFSDRPPVLRQEPGLSARQHTVDLLISVFNNLGRPIRLADLIDIVAKDAKAEGRGARAIDGASDSESEGDVYTPDYMVGLAEQGYYLKQVWEEICLLPLDQRRALLLNLRDSQGNDLTATFAHLDIAGIRLIADMVAIPATEFAELWSDLPLDDNAIAHRLGVTRQRVISLRQSARRRLSRRLKELKKVI
jgi:DNA-directed RNA polymerase specialized sigma24 family protein